MATSESMKRRIEEFAPQVAEETGDAGDVTSNLARLDYSRCRQNGLPVKSARMESFAKEMNYRVKGTEKFWNDGPAAEAIL